MCIILSPSLFKLPRVEWDTSSSLINLSTTIIYHTTRRAATTAATHFAPATTYQHLLSSFTFALFCTCRPISRRTYRHTDTNPVCEDKSPKHQCFVVCVTLLLLILTKSVIEVCFHSLGLVLSVYAILSLFVTGVSLCQKYLGTDGLIRAAAEVTCG